MTNPSEVVVSDEEIEAFLAPLRARYLRPALRLALADFLAKRVPDANTERDDINDESGMFTNGFGAGFNACRERVLKWE